MIVAENSHVSDRRAPVRAGAAAHLYVVEAMQCLASTLLCVGIYYFTERRFGWGLRENFLLATGQGGCYVIGALASNMLAGRWGRRSVIVAVNLTQAAIMVAPLTLALTPALTAGALVAYMFLSAITWPALESLVSAGADSAALSRRLGFYNIVWSFLGAVSASAAGTIIDRFPAGMFAIPVAAHVGVAAVLLTLRGSTISGQPAQKNAEAPGELLNQRRLALWLSRIALPATYVVIYSLVAMMPLLPVIQQLPMGLRTLAGSVWLGARCAAFAALFLTVWWHGRPRLLLWAAGAMLVGFLGVAVPGSAGADNLARSLAMMVGAQLLLGVAIGTIYAGSLYFGMVLSDGSTEHGGYHEALIGLGQLLGPGTGALTQLVWPGNVTAGIVAVAGVIGITVVAAGVAARRAGRASE